MNSVRVTICVVFVVALSVIGGTGGVAAQQSQQSVQVDSDSVVIDVSIAADGTATWTIQYRVLLDDENTTAAFEDLQADIQSNTSVYTQQFTDRITRTVQTAENTTGRDMAVQNVSVSADTTAVPRSYGVVSYSFEWHGFAAVDGQTLRVGDALTGFFLDADTRLTMSVSDGYRITSTHEQATGDSAQSLTWTGPHEFGTDFSFVGEPQQDDLAVYLWGALGGVLVLVYVWYRRRHNPERTTTAGNETTESPDDELLSDEERVLELLAANDGRLKQQTIVEQTVWTEAKTSRLLSRMEENGQIQKLPIGRENIIAEPDVDLMDD